jgi:L-amino acid N-acyltransferase YncA
MTEPLLRIRPSVAEDIASITEIYATSVRDGTGSFEIEPPDAAEMARRRSDVVKNGLPWLVAEAHSGMLGYAYAGPFRPRPAYRYCLEDSVYLRSDARGRGVGRWLLAELIARCEALGARQMVAVIGDSANTASIRLHAAQGFRSAGRIAAAGWKFERWLDVVFMQRSLGPGQATPPRA